MAPLPCSPVSNSTASESHSFPPSEVSSDESLTTPRPGPSDPSQRTVENLSRPSIPVYSTSPTSARALDCALGGIRRDGLIGGSAEGRPRNPYTYGLSPRPDDTAPATSLGDSKVRFSPPQRSPSAPSRIASPKRNSNILLSQHSASPRRKSNASPLPDAHKRMAGRSLEEFAESSADENTAIVKRSTDKSSYGTTAFSGAVLEDDARDESLLGTDQTSDQIPSQVFRRKSSSTRSRNNETTPKGPNPTRVDRDTQGSRDGWLRKIAEKYGSVELENKGSVARDHLALERTFLAWLRTSLSFASIGIAITQLFRLNTTITTPDGNEIHLFASVENLRAVGKPLGATFLGISILILLLGFHRFFESQHYVIRGKFPASRGTILLVTFVTTGLIEASLVVVVAISPTAFEKR